jgi:hypothetical protein
MNDSNELAQQRVKVRLKTLEIVMEDWVKHIVDKVEGLTEEQRSQLAEALRKDTVIEINQTHICGGYHINGNQQFILSDDGIAKLIGTMQGLATTINEQYGAEIGAEIIKVAIMAFANVLSK